MDGMKLDSKYFDSIRSKRSKSARVDDTPSKPVCQWDGCEKPGAHRAPVGRNAEGQYFVFCFEHVKDYNKGYNYFSGLSDNEVARYQKEAVTGNRPTWSMGVNKNAKWAPAMNQARTGASKMRDPFGFAGWRLNEAKAEARDRRLKPLEGKAFETLELAAGATASDIKSRYKELVKKHHPDANGGDRGSEERFRAVIQAYQLLKQAGFC
ncbi:MAG: putative 19 [Rhizobium sp.]|nr:putative 19 [Rhizobium sp.]